MLVIKKPIETNIIFEKFFSTIGFKKSPVIATGIDETMMYINNMKSSLFDLYFIYLIVPINIFLIVSLKKTHNANELAKCKKIVKLSC